LEFKKCLESTIKVIKGEVVVEFRAEDYKLLADLERPGTVKHKKLRAKAATAGALVKVGDLELINRTILLNYLTEKKQVTVKARQEKKQNRPQTGNRYSHIKTIGKLGQSEAAIRRAIGPREKAIELFYAQLDSETDEEKRSKISSSLGDKLDDKADAEFKLEQISVRRAEIEKETKSRIEQGRKSKAKKADSSKEKTENQDK
jgi:hypothetical protein